MVRQCRFFRFENENVPSSSSTAKRYLILLINTYLCKTQIKDEFGLGKMTRNLGNTNLQIL